MPIKSKAHTLVEELVRLNVPDRTAVDTDLAPNDAYHGFNLSIRLFVTLKQCGHSEISKTHS